jgi:tetratricopeptide (TPR) repeat protein
MPEEAIECYDEVLTLDPNRLKIWTKKGNFLLMLKRYEDAIECYDRALDVDPQIELRKEEEVMKAGWNDFPGISIDPHETQLWKKEIWNNKGRALHLLGNKTLKAVDFRAQDYNQVSTQAFGYLNQALTCYDKALEIDPIDEVVWYNEAVLFFDGYKFDEAIQRIDQALKIKSTDVKVASESIYAFLSSIKT